MTRFLATIITVTAGLGAACGYADPKTGPGWGLGEPSAAGIDGPSQGGSENDGHEDSPGVERSPGADDPVVASEAESCEPVLEQWIPRESYWVELGYVGFVGSALLAIADGYGMASTGIRVADGELFSGAAWAGGFAGASSGELLVVRKDWSGVAVRNVRTGEEVWSTPEQEPHTSAAAIDATGSRLALLQCEYDAPARVEQLALPSGARLSSTELDGSACFSWSENTPRVAFAQGGVVASVSAGRLHFISADGVVTTVDAHPGLGPEADPTVTTPAIHGFAVSPDGTRAVTTGADGMLRVWSLPELREVEAPRPVTTATINEWTYAPHYTVSPVFFSPGGQFLGFVDERGSVVIEKDGDQWVLEEPSWEPTEDWMQQTNPPVQVAWSPDGARIAVARYHGVALYGCPAPEIAVDTRLHVEVPQRLRATDGELRIPAPGLVGMFHRLTVDGDTWMTPVHVDGDELVAWVGTTPGTHAARLEVTDGVSSGAADFAFDVVQGR